MSEEGLFQFGHSKDHRPDLPQLKVVLSVLDPLGMPVATQVISGERADDPLYVPAIRQVHEGLQRSGLLYVGDCKMGALATRAWVCAQGDYYLCPLAQRQMPAETVERYLQPVWAEKLPPSLIYRQNAQGQLEQIAVGFEQEVAMTQEVEGRLITWSKRHLIVRSLQQAETLEKGLRTRLARAQAQLEQLNERKAPEYPRRDGASGAEDSQTPSG